MKFDPRNLQRRVAGWHDQRLDGVSDILSRARGASVLDVGCNRGLVSLEFAQNGATRVHGVDNFDEGIATCRHVFADLRYVQESRFEVTDLTLGARALTVLDDGGVRSRYDIVVMLATYHKLRRVMKGKFLEELVVDLARRCDKFFVWRGTVPKPETEHEFEEVDSMLTAASMQNVQYSEISDIGPSGIWEKTQ